MRIIDKAKERFLKYVVRPENTEQCWVWTGHLKPEGYGRIKINGRFEYAHRVSYVIHVGKIPKGLWVLHHCDNPNCVNPKHLYIGNHADNMRDRTTRGRGVNQVYKGESNPNAKLTWDNVNTIRNMYATGQYTYVQLGEIYNVGFFSIGRIIRQNYWKR